MVTSQSATEKHRAVLRDKMTRSRKAERLSGSKRTPFQAIFGPVPHPSDQPKQSERDG
jgi:hypothetical protein